MPPMLMIAALGSAWGMHGLWAMFQGLTWLTWFAVGLIATGTVAWRGIGHLVRSGAWGLTRPRWWFEVARLAFLAALCDVLVLLLVISLFPNAPRGPLGSAATLAFISAGPLFVFWVLIASVGYVLAWVRWLPLRGKAFDCVHYFYALVVGIWLAVIGIVMLEPQQPLLVQVVAGTTSIAGVAVLAAGFVSIIVRWEKLDRSGGALGGDGVTP
jgi:hypothetical protein